MEKYHIFCPEDVPLTNKGEEAIIRGMADVLFPEGNVEFHILEMDAEEYRYVDGLHVYPGKWFYSVWRTKEFGLGFSARKIYSSACSLLRHGLNKFFPGWLRKPQGPLKDIERILKLISNGGEVKTEKEKCIERIMQCDYLVAGHDGAFDEYDCHVIELMQKYGMKFGVFGTSLKPKLKNKVIIEIFEKTLGKADFIYCRNELAVKWGNRVFSNDVGLNLAPDPAFGMRPSDDVTADKIISNEGLKDFFDKPVVMATTCEPAPIARHCFCGTNNPEKKLQDHRKFLAKLFNHIIESYDVNVLFLPHAIGPGVDLDDRIVSKDVMQISGISIDRVRIITNEYSARDLKALISRAELLVAERVHSMIGSVGVETPFLCLGSNTDPRVEGIVGKMLKSEDLIYFLNHPELDKAKEKFDYVWSERGNIRNRFRGIYEGFEKEYQQCASEMKQYIVSDIK